MIYAMTGGNGAGKTTYARKISREKDAQFFSLDKTIRDFNQPIHSYEDYMRYFNRAMDLMSSQAIQILKEGRSVVFDFGGGLATRSWLKTIAALGGNRPGAVHVEIFHLEVPREERKRRIQERNRTKDPDVCFFNMSDDEFDRHNQEDPLPPPTEAGILVTRVTKT